MSKENLSEKERKKRRKLALPKRGTKLSDISEIGQSQNEGGDIQMEDPEEREQEEEDDSDSFDGKLDRLRRDWFATLSYPRVFSGLIFFFL